MTRENHYELNQEEYNLLLEYEYNKNREEDISRLEKEYDLKQGVTYTFVIAIINDNLTMLKTIFSGLNQRQKNGLLNYYIQCDFFEKRSVVQYNSSSFLHGYPIQVALKLGHDSIVSFFKKIKQNNIGMSTIGFLQELFPSVSQDKESEKKQDAESTTNYNF